MMQLLVSQNVDFKGLNFSMYNIITIYSFPVVIFSVKNVSAPGLIMSIPVQCAEQQLPKKIICGKVERRHILLSYVN
ncbi:unnamed protein product [Brugia timori]|uniref:Uncharacterized protein n=1 Tax=Brugia timori TaxID=42155 RepID=A0A3P7ZYI5_9BILA|nr:unnamed protein product [Brugia timori]